MVPNPRRLPLVSWLPVRSILAFLVVLSFILPAHALAQTAGVSSPSARIGAVLVADDFKNPERGLLPRASIEPDSYEQGYEAGYYVVRGVDDEWEGAVTLDLSGAYRDTRLSVDVKSIGERAGGIYLECRRGPTSGYGGVFFLDSGRYFIDRRDGSSWTPLTRNATSPYGRLRNTGFNLAMTCVGDRISLALDGMEIVSVRDRDRKSVV